MKHYLAIILIFLMASTSSAWAAPPDEAYKFRSATWNMQGSGSSSGDSKWAQVKTMLLGTSSNSALDIITLQESGALPDSITDTPEESNQTLVVTELHPWGPQSVMYPGDVHEVQWNIGSTTRPNTFYIYQLDMGNGANNRLNTAIVSRYRADDIYVLPAEPATSSTRRPILGIRIGNSAFFNIHAAAIGGGNEAPEQVIAVENAMRNHINNVSSWMILGDYNRSPNSLILSSAFGRNPTNNHFTRQVAYDRSRIATQQSGNILDYAIIGASRFILIDLVRATVMHNIHSDHYAVRFNSCG